MRASYSNRSFSPLPAFSSLRNSSPCCCRCGALAPQLFPLVVLSSKLFRVRTSEKHVCNSRRFRTSKTQDLKPFGMDTYKKIGGGVGLIVNQAQYVSSLATHHILSFRAKRGICFLLPIGAASSPSGLHRDVLGAPRLSFAFLRFCARRNIRKPSPLYDLLHNLRTPGGGGTAPTALNEGQPTLFHRASFARCILAVLFQLFTGRWPPVTGHCSSARLRELCVIFFSPLASHERLPVAQTSICAFQRRQTRLGPVRWCLTSPAWPLSLQTSPRAQFPRPLSRRSTGSASRPSMYRLRRSASEFPATPPSPLCQSRNERANHFAKYSCLRCAPHQSANVVSFPRGDASRNANVRRFRCGSILFQSFLFSANYFRVANRSAEAEENH
jgi:hypothetical protein